MKLYFTHARNSPPPNHTSYSTRLSTEQSYSFSSSHTASTNKLNNFHKAFLRSRILQNSKYQHLFNSSYLSTIKSRNHPLSESFSTNQLLSSTSFPSKLYPKTKPILTNTTSFCLYNPTSPSQTTYNFHKQIQAVRKEKYILSLKKNKLLKKQCNISNNIGLTEQNMKHITYSSKLLTCFVKEYDFYRPENILIVDRDNPVVDVDFLKSQWKEIPNDIYEKYSLRSWLNSIFKI